MSTLSSCHTFQLKRFRVLHVVSMLTQECHLLINFSKCHRKYLTSVVQPRCFDNSTVQRKGNSSLFFHKYAKLIRIDRMESQTDKKTQTKTTCDPTPPPPPPQNRRGILTYDYQFLQVLVMKINEPMRMCYYSEINYKINDEPICL